MRIVNLLFVLILATGSIAQAGPLSCSFRSAIGPAFPPYNVYGTSNDVASGSLAYSCTKSNVPISIDLNRGLNPGASSTLNMTSGTSADLLNYNLYMDAAHTMIFGNGLNGTSHYVGTTGPASTVYTLPIYGSIPSQQDISIGQVGS